MLGSSFLDLKMEGIRGRRGKKMIFAIFIYNKEAIGRWMLAVIVKGKYEKAE